MRTTSAAIACSLGRPAISSRPITLRAVADRGWGERARTSSSTPLSNIACVRSLDPPLELVLRHIQPDDQRRPPRLPGPEPVLGARERPPCVRELERAHDAPAIVRVDARGRSGVELGEVTMGRLAALCVVEASASARAGPPVARAAARARRAQPSRRDPCRRRPPASARRRGSRPPQRGRAARTPRPTPRGRAARSRRAAPGAWFVRIGSPR